MINIAIFASGSGTNAEEIIRYFVLSEKYKVALVFSNRPKAGVLERAKRLGVPFEVLEKKDLTGPALMALMKRYEIDFIVLAGFLCMVPDELTKAYPKRIVNIHPALLPKFGGKGMYGALMMRVKSFSKKVVRFLLRILLRWSPRKCMRWNMRVIQS